MTEQKEVRNSMEENYTATNKKALTINMNLLKNQSTKHKSSYITRRK